MSSSTERLPAALAGRHRVERELGQGGMATVYLAEDLKHDRKVALKVLKPELAAVLRVALADRSRIERELGAGEMATVYLAEGRKTARAQHSTTGPSRLIETWRDSDPALVPARREVAARRDALKR